MREPDEAADIDLGYLRLYDTALLSKDLLSEKRGSAEVIPRSTYNARAGATRDEDGTAPMMPSASCSMTSRATGLLSLSVYRHASRFPRQITCRGSAALLVHTLGYELPRSNTWPNRRRRMGAEVTEDVLEKRQVSWRR